MILLHYDAQHLLKLLYKKCDIVDRSTAVIFHFRMWYLGGEITVDNRTPYKWTVCIENQTPRLFYDRYNTVMYTQSLQQSAIRRWLKLFSVHVNSTHLYIQYITLNTQCVVFSITARTQKFYSRNTTAV